MEMVEQETTRARILGAARDAFAEAGLAGARVDDIARRAGCNKQLLYHYFGDKNGLYEAVVRDLLCHRPPLIGADREAMIAGIGRIAEGNLPVPRGWFRMLMWEALANPSGEAPLVAEDVRTAHLALGVQDVEAAQARGLFDDKLPPRMILLAMMSLVILPFVLPQLVRLVTGLRPDSPEFRSFHADLLREFARRFGPTS